MDFSTNAPGTIGHPHAKKKKKTIKLKDNIGKDLEAFSTFIFLDRTPKVESMELMIDELGFVKVKNFWCAKEH